MLRPRRKSLPPLLSPHEVRELGSWLSRKDLDDADRHSPEEASLWRDGLLGLRRLWAASHALAGDPSALPKLAAWLAESEEVDDHEVLADLARAMRVLASRDPKHRRYLRDLAEHRFAVVQAEAVRALDPNEAEERRTLEKLVQATAAPRVAQEAEKKLRKAGRGLWWRGLFTEDPMAGLSAEEQGELLPLARRLVALYATPALNPDERVAIPDLLEKLPARPAVDAARTLLKSARHRLDPFEVLSAVCRHEAAAAMWVELLEDDEGGDLDLDLDVHRILGYGENTRAFPEPFAVRVADVLLARLAGYTAAEVDDTDGRPWRLAWLLREIWPPGRDPKPVLDLLLHWGAQIEEGGDEGRRGGFLDGAVAKHGAGKPWVRPTFERALGENFRPPWQLLKEALPRLVASEPPEVRLAWAMEVVQRREPGPSLAWAMEELRKETPAFLVDCYDDPVLRPHVLDGAIPAPLLDRVRADFLAGRLTPGEVESVLHALTPAHRLAPFRERDTASDLETPPEDGRALTEEEWDALRTYRERHPAPELIRHLRLAVGFPPGEWHPRDLAWFERAREAMLEDSAENAYGYLENLCWVAAHKADARVLAALEDAADRCHWVDEEEGIENAIALLREKLGLPEEQDGGGAGEEDEDEWEGEDGEDDDGEDDDGEDEDGEDDDGEDDDGEDDDGNE